jgi:hypothetical protein
MHTGPWEWNTVDAVDVDDGVAGGDELDTDRERVVKVFASDRCEHPRDTREGLHFEMKK